MSPTNMFFFTSHLVVFTPSFSGCYVFVNHAPHSFSKISEKSGNVKVNSFGGPERFNQRVEARFVVVGDSGDPGLELSPFQKEQTVA